MRSDRKQTIIFVIILLILSMGIGYAYLTITLSINGVTDVDSNTWDVHWNNIQVTSGSVTGELVTEAPTISPDGSASIGGNNSQCSISGSNLWKGQSSCYSE